MARLDRSQEVIARLERNVVKLKGPLFVDPEGFRKEMRAVNADFQSRTARTLRRSGKRRY